LLGRQYTALSEGYRGALGAAQKDLERQSLAGQALGQLGQTQQTLGAAGLKTLYDLGAKEQELGQRVLDQPMKQAQDYSKLLTGAVIPASTTKQTIGSTGYSNSPLSQISGLLALLGSFSGGNTGTAQNSTSSDLGVAQQAVNLANSIKKFGGYADGGMVNPQVAYTDGQGNFYDASGYLVE
jgi:hypothetical protein